MKKLLLSLGTVAAVVAPVASVIACGSSDDNSTTLEGLKKANLKAVSDSTKMSATEKADAVRKINAAKDIDALTKVMADLAPKLGATVVPTTGADDTYKAPDTKYADAFDTFANDVAIEVNVPVDANRLVEQKGDLVRITYTMSTDASDTPETTTTDTQVNPKAVRVVVNSKTAKLVSVEAKIDSNFVERQMDDEDIISNIEGSIKDLSFVIKSIDASMGTVIAGRSKADAKTDAKAKATKLLSDINYSMEDAELDKLIEYLVTTAGPEAVLNLKGVNHGLLIGKTADPTLTHGADDFMIMIKGGTVKDLSSEDGISRVVAKNSAPVLEITNPANANQKRHIGSELDPEDQVLAEKWGESASEAADTHFVIYFQTNDETGITTCQVSEVVKFGNRFFSFDTSDAAALKANPDVAYAAPYGYHSFIAKEVPTTQNK